MVELKQTRLGEAELKRGMGKAIKIRDENYQWLLKIASDIQKKVGKPVSFDEALTEIKEKIEKRGKKE